MVSLHAEVRSDEDILVIHDAIDRIEMELRGKFHCEATIHMDPIEVDDAATNAMRARVREAVRAIDPALSIHDFRMVVSPTHTNLIFDVCVPAPLPHDRRAGLPLRAREHTQSGRALLRGHPGRARVPVGDKDEEDAGTPRCAQIDDKSRLSANGAAGGSSNDEGRISSELKIRMEFYP